MLIRRACMLPSLVCHWQGKGDSALIGDACARITLQGHVCARSAYDSPRHPDFVSALRLSTAKENHARKTIVNVT